MKRLIVVYAVLALAAPGHSAAQTLLVPMDDQQANHLRAYGLVYQSIEAGERAEWLLNYRGGSFLLPGVEHVKRSAALLGVTVDDLTGARLASLRALIEESNMEAVPLEKAPGVAVYTPPNSSPWDDAVTLALEYAGIPYERIWDDDVLRDGLDRYDWLHLHHEDFTGQYSKFYLGYAGSDWLRDEVQRNEAVASEFGFVSVPELKRAVAEAIRSYVEAGGLLFAMCTATETLDLALAAANTDLAASFADGTPPDPSAEDRMIWERALAFTDARLVLDGALSAFSDIDGHQVNTPWRQPLGSFELFDFSAKIDPVPAMLTQSHERVIPDFYGLTTSFKRERLKPGVVGLGSDEAIGVVKYLHGQLGEGSFTFLGGHDPEDPQHLVGDSPTDLDLHRSSAGYRLILNNVLYPAARKKALKT
ncbi:MAG: asparagine synthetase B [Gemmatimonadetes bacterium]|nr:asparagine synthetase B [Gemmatimonadota bacterium]NNK47620.1 asparagine synthetase B [Gemmatimonadota bacterium]